MSVEQGDLEFDAVGRVVEIVDLIADQEDADPDDVCCAALSKIRKRREGNDDD